MGQISVTCRDLWDGALPRGGHIPGREPREELVSHRSPLPGPGPGCPPDQLWQHPRLQPEGLVLRAQPVDGRLRGHQGCDSAVGRKRDASSLCMPCAEGREEGEGSPHPEIACSQPPGLPPCTAREM